MKMQPLGDRILVAPDASDQEQIGGIYLPDQAKEKPQHGKVLALGTGRRDSDGKRMPFCCKVGDEIMYSKYGIIDMKVEGKNYAIIRNGDVIAVVG